MSKKKITRGRPRKFTYKQERSIASRYRKGERAEDLGVEFGASHVTILSVARRQKVEVRNQGTITGK